MAVYELTSARVGTPTGSTPRPAPVLLVDGFTSPNSVRVRWSYSGGGTVAHWLLSWRAAGGTWSTPATVPAASVWAEVAGLTANTAYEVRLSAVVAGVESARAVVTATTQQAGFNGVPLDLTRPSATKTSLTVQWVWPLLEGVTGFKVYHRVKGASAWSGPVDVGSLLRSAQINGLVANTQYEVRVYAWVTLLGVTRYSNPSATATFTTLP